MVTRFCHCTIGTMFVRPARCESLPFKAKHLWETSETWQRFCCSTGERCDSQQMQVLRREMPCCGTRFAAAKNYDKTAVRLELCRSVRKVTFSASVSGDSPATRPYAALPANCTRVPGLDAEVFDLLHRYPCPRCLVHRTMETNRCPRGRDDGEPRTKAGSLLAGRAVLSVACLVHRRT
jgi:hypothetical protein